ncbi:MAG: ATP-binding cassette domain-containing protein [Fibrobacteres bacterium]|nr:ATP-binding cassette domain-containing protein [Fibrobacterota bacterium]
MEALLRAHGITRRYGPGCALCLDSTGADAGTNRCPTCGSVWACRDVSLELRAEEALGIVGESGSGKSTLVKLLHFDDPATSGYLELARLRQLEGIGGIYADGCDWSRDLFSMDRYRQRRVRDASMGIVYQHPHLGLRMGVSSGGNVAERLLSAGWRSIGAMRQRASHLLERTEIPLSRMDEPPRNFSGGMQQRVQIAKALSGDPPILLLDEVSTGLDLSVQARVLDMIRTLREELRLSMVVVSHDLGVIHLLCQRTMVMKNGQVVESGLTDQILQDPQHGYTQLLVASQLQ